MRIFNIKGDYGDCPIQAPTVELAAALYPTLKGWKVKSLPANMTVECTDTGQKFELMGRVAYVPREVK